MVKIGQGGTLDPLAGELAKSPFRFTLFSFDCHQMVC